MAAPVKHPPPPGLSRPRPALFGSGSQRAAIFEDRHLARDPPDFFVTDRTQPLAVVAKRRRDITRYHTGDVMRFRRLFHSRGDIDGAPVDADRALGVALLADHHLAAMDSDPEAWHDAELLLELGALALHRADHRVDRPQDPIVLDGVAPLPQRNQPIALVEIDFAAEIGDRL